MHKDKSLIHLAVLRFSSMGDVAMMLPVLKIALEQNCKIALEPVEEGMCGLVNSHSFEQLN